MMKIRGVINMGLLNLVVEPAKIRWKAMSKRLYIVKTYGYKGEQYVVFFRYAPSVFKTRGEYFTFNIRDERGINDFIQSYPDYEKRFPTDTEGNIKWTDRIPHLMLDDDNLYLLNFFSGDNTIKEVNDLLDVLDFVAELNGNIHLNPFTEENKFKKYFEDGESGFTLSENITDYNRPVVEFVTSREKSSLSYGFLLMGTELTETGAVTRGKYHTYPIIDGNGEVAVKIVEFTVPSKDYLLGIKRFLGDYLEGPMNILPNNHIHFKVDTSKLKPIKTVHDLIVTEDLIREREQVRLLLKSKNNFKRSISNMAKQAGVPIPYRYSNLYNDHSKSKPKPYTEISYKNEDVSAGDVSMDKILKDGSIKSMKYIEELVQMYLSGKVPAEFIQTHIDKSGKVFKNELISNTFKDLFTGIIGRTSLTEMYEDADKVSQGLEYLSNILKIKLKPFGRYGSEDVNNFIYSMYTCGLKDIAMTGENELFIQFPTTFLTIKSEVFD